MATESRSLARVCYRAAFGVARRLVVTARRVPEPHLETDVVQALGPTAAPTIQASAPRPACGEQSRTITPSQPPPSRPLVLRPEDEGGKGRQKAGP
jgi:hypothetical protein